MEMADGGIMTPPSVPYKRHRFPPQFISYAVWLYCRFTLKFRDVKEMLLQRGIIVSYEAIRYWCRMFGRTIANAADTCDT